MAGKRKSLDEYIATYGEEVGRSKYMAYDKAKQRAKAGKQIDVDLSTPTKQQEAVDRGDAVRCLECGAVKTRLQHTHFKNKCSGRFQSGKEYQQVHIGAEVVAPNLRKLTGGTLDNYIKLHGPVEGQRLWDEYKAKQAHSNTFEYKQEKHGWTEDQFNEYNLSRASTKENFIERHGEAEGTKKWKEYVERQAYTTTLEYFVEEYGEAEGTKKYNAFNKARFNVIVDGQSSGMELDFLELLIDNVSGAGLGIKTQCQVGNNSRLKFDAVWPHKRKALEFNGTNWHADPSRYTADQVIPFVNQTAQEIWNKDAAKIKLAEEAGYSVFVVWQREFERKHLHADLLKRLQEWWDS